MPPSPDFSNSEHVWISPHDQMPDVCCICGMFSDQTAVVKHVDYEKRASGDMSVGALLLAIVLHVFLGPIGWLFSALAEGGGEGTKTVKLKSKVKISQCRLCQGAGKPEIVDSKKRPKRFLFTVHREFKRRFVEVNSVSNESPANGRLAQGGPF